MLVGHVAVGMLGKRAAPEVSLGTLVFAAVLCDLLWGAFLLAGVEHIRILPGAGAARYLEGTNISLSHSAAMTVLWAALLAVIWFMLRRDARGAVILAALVVSHWVLDIVSGIMPIAPGLHARAGLGLWRSIPATLIVEGGLWLIALLLYARAAKHRIVLWIGAVLLTLIWYNNIAGPPPPSVRAAAIGALVLFSLIVAWAWWTDTARRNRIRTALSR